MMFPTTDIHAVLESKTVHTVSKKVTDTLHLTTVLMQIHCTDYSFYSIGVLALDETSQADFRMVHDITREYDEAERIFKAITDGNVTPCTLEDVLCDMIGIL